jgi:uncharacterized protein (TIGR03437 family)
VAFGWGAAAPAQTLPTVSAVPAAIAFSYQIGAATLPAAQTVQIKRSGSGTALDFTVAVPGTANWLIVTPSAGKTGTAISVRVNPTSLLAGTYSADVTITATGALAPATLTAVLVVKNPPPAMAVSASSLAFTFTTGGTAPVDQTVDVSSGGEPVLFTAVVSGGAWLAAKPTPGVAMAGRPVTMTVSVVTTGMLPGTYTAKITLTSSNASNKSAIVSVSLVVSPGTAVIASVWPSSAPIGSLDQTVTIRGSHLFKASVVNVGGTTTLASTWIAIDAMLVVIPQGLLSTAGALSITVTNSPQPASNASTFTVTPLGPVIQSVVNAASFVSAAKPLIAPGEILSIFGSGLGPAALTQATPAGVPLAYPLTLGTPATTVEFELATGVWTPAPLIFVQANQINLVAPFTVPATANLNLRVTYGLLTPAVMVFDGVAAQPGLFTSDSSGRGQAAALNYDAAKDLYTLNSASNPAVKGSIVVLYGTGGGVTSTLPTPEGLVIPATLPVPTVAGTVAVTIGGDGATVQSATAVPGSIAGLMQLNVVVPLTVKAGKDLPVVISVGGQSSNAYATLSVK